MSRKEQAQEAERLCERILSATNSIPPSVQNGSYQTAVTFKEAAIKARKVAEKYKGKGNLGKMKEAWVLISNYYE